jgi:branched-chain amino acid aminotransferase
MCATTSGCEIVCPPPIGSASLAHASCRRCGVTNCARSTAPIASSTRRSPTWRLSVSSSCCRVDSRAMPLACLDGVVADAQETLIPVDDAGLLRGDGVFEVIRLYAGRPFAMEDHLTRMVGSAERLRLPLDIDAFRSDAQTLLGAAAPQDALLRLVQTRGGRRIATIEPVPDRSEPVKLAFVEYAPTRTLDGVKSLSYAANMLATRLAVERGADEALLVTPHGRLLEGPTSSFFYVLGGTLYTPPLSDHILDSITRRRLVAALAVEERSVAVDEVPEMSEAFLAGTTREAQPVSEIEGRPLPQVPGPLTSRAGEAFRELVEAELGS